MKQYGFFTVYRRPQDAARAEECVARAIPDDIIKLELLVHYPPQPKHPDPYRHHGTVGAKWLA